MRTRVPALLKLNPKNECGWPRFCTGYIDEASECTENDRVNYRMAECSKSKRFIMTRERPGLVEQKNSREFTYLYVRAGKAKINVKRIKMATTLLFPAPWILQLKLNTHLDRSWG